MRGINPDPLLVRRGAPRPVREILATLLQGVSFTRRSANKEIVRVWEQVVGPEVSRHAWVSALRANILYIEVDSGAWMQELGGFHKAGILAEIQGRLKGVFVRDLKFKQRGGSGDRRSDEVGEQREI